MGGVERQVPVEVSGLHYVEAEFKLDALIAYGTDIGGLRSDEGRGGHCYRKEKICGLLVIIVNGTAQSVIPDAEVHTEVELAGLLPLDVGVGVLLRQYDGDHLAIDDV